MPNNIIMLDDELKRRELDKQQEAKDTFENADLTEEEKRVLAEIDQEAHTVVNENNTSTPITKYAEPLDQSIKTIGDGKPMLKLVNTGDVVQTVTDARNEARERALKAFHDLAVNASDDLSDDAIVAINDKAIAAISEYCKTSRITADQVNKTFGRMTLSQLVKILPKDFVALYTTESEITANNVKAKERLVASLVYLTTVGPEMDYLNDYIENEHRLTLVSQRLLQCSIDLVEALKSEEKMSEIADRAAEIDPPKDMHWEKYISGNARKIHNMFAQNAAIYEEYVKAYTKLRDEYSDMESLALIDEQISESRMKVKVYSSICKLDLFKEMVDRTREWLMGNPKMNHDRLKTEAFNAMERIRRSKQDVPFPTYQPQLAKYPKELFAAYQKEFPKMLANYNSAIIKLQGVVKGENESTEDLPQLINIDGILEATVHEYFALLLLVVFGRIMKKLGDRSTSKEDALTLDCYFTLYCAIGTDSYLMDDVWEIMKSFVDEAICKWGCGVPGKR